jgi:NADH-quinone oxidoreductase subunit K
VVERWSVVPKVTGSNPVIYLFVFKMLGLNYMFLLPLCLFFVGFGGILFNRRSIIAIIICIELLLLAVNLQLSFSSFIFDDILGYIFSLFVLSIAAAESAIGLSILVGYYKVRGNISVETINLIKG